VGENPPPGRDPPVARLRPAHRLRRLWPRPRRPAKDGSVFVLLGRVPPCPEADLPRMRSTALGILRSAGPGTGPVRGVPAVRAKSGRRPRGRRLRRTGPIGRARGQASLPPGTVPSHRRPDGCRPSGLGFRRRISRAGPRTVPPVVRSETGFQPGNRTRPPARPLAETPAASPRGRPSLVPVGDRQAPGAAWPDLLRPEGLSIKRRNGALSDPDR